MANYDVIVVGGGLVGLAFALDLARNKPVFRIAILEQNEYTPPNFTRFDNKVYAISPENVDYLTDLGVWPDNRRVGTIKIMDVSGDTNSNIILDNKLAKQVYLAKTVECNNLQHQLYGQLENMLNVDFIYDKLLEVVHTTDYVELVGQNNNYRSRLIVGADGANSFMREQAGIVVDKVDYQYSAVVANFSCEYPHQNVAYQWFKDKGVLAYLPLMGNNISIVWACEQSSQLLALPDTEFAACVASTGENKLGQLKLITPAAVFPLKLYLVDKIYQDRIVLIGDAAHTIHPLAGQGVNLGFNDAQVLARLLSSCQVYQLGDSAILAKYNVLRLSIVRQMQLTCHYLQRLFVVDNPLLQQLRNSGLNLVDSLAPVKKYLIKEAVTY